jgi:hypothetical protein
MAEKVRKEGGWERRRKYPIPPPNLLMVELSFPISYNPLAGRKTSRTP